MRRSLNVLYILVISTLSAACLARATVINAQCQIKATDAYGQPVSDVAVTLQLEGPVNGSDSLQDAIFAVAGTTDATGTATLSVTSPNGEYQSAVCFTLAGGSGYTIYGNELFLYTYTDNTLLTSETPVQVVPKPITISLAGGGSADLYLSGAYDKPVVVAQPQRLLAPALDR